MLPTSEYWRNYRASHPAYRARELERTKKRGHPERAVPGSRSAEYAKRLESKVVPVVPLLPDLFPDLVRGGAIIFWNEELNRDLRQEAALAELEGRDPGEAVASYRAREYSWFKETVEMLDD